VTRLAPAAAFLLLAIPLAACAGPDWCVDRGSGTAYQGSAQFAGSVPALSGAAPMTLVVDDLDVASQTFHSDPPSCDATFTVRLGSSCVLWAGLADVNYDTGKNSSGDFVQADVSVTANGACSLPLADGPVALAVREGTMSLTPGHVELTFDGTIEAPDGGVPPQYLSVIYNGQ
jgi:hypothetical protein